MPIEKPKGIRLRDLYKDNTRGWSDLSVDERKAYLEGNPELKDKSFKYISNVYDNRKYIKEFGLPAFEANPDKASRDAELRKRYKDNAIRDMFGDGFEDEDSRYNISTKAQLNDLSVDAFEALLDSDFEFPSDRKERKEEEKNMPSFLRGAMNAHEKGGVGRQKSVTEEWDELAKEKNRDILDRIVAKNSKVDLANSSQVSDRILSDINQMDEVSFNNMFHDIVEGDKNEGYSGVGVYNTFKNNHEMKDFGPEQKKKLVADYLAVLETTKNPARAEQAISNYLQDYIHNQQTAWDWWGSAMSGIGTKAAGDFGNLIVGTHALAGLAAYGEDWLNNYLQGLDENGTERSWWDNMKYWNGVDQYNTFDHDAIWRIEENGGISPYNWLSEAGNERNISSALNEGMKMVGYTLAQTALSYAMGAGLKGFAKAAGGVFSEAGALLEGSSQASRAIMEASPVVISMINAIPIATAYAKGSYDKVYQEAMQNLELMKQEELGEALKESGLSGDELLYYRDAKKAELDEAYKRLEEEARKEATSAYERNATIEWLRMSGVNYLFKDWQFDKSVRLAKNSNFPGIQAVEKGGNIAMTGTLLGNAVNPKYARYYDMAKAVWGGFESNYMDDVTAAYAQGFSLGRYNNTLAQAFNPEKAVAGSSWVAGFTSALASAGDAFFDPQSWYDGFIGALGTIQAVTPRVGGMARGLTRTGRLINQYNVDEIERYANNLGLSKGQYVRGEGYEKIVRQRMPDATEAEVQEQADNLRNAIGFEALVNNGTIKKLSTAERVNNYIMNPLLQSYSDAAQRERDFQGIIDAGNRAISEKKGAINDILNVVNALNTREQALVDGGLMDIHEAKAYKAFTLATLLDSWGRDPVLSQSQFVQESQAKIERMAKGQVSEADITEFLSYNENKDIASQPNGMEIAKQRLQDNAKQLLDMQREYSKTMEDVRSSNDYMLVANTSEGGAESVAKQIAFNNVMDSNRRERVRQMSEETGVHTVVGQDGGNPAIYGSEQGRQNALSQAVEEKNTLLKQLDEASNKLNAARKISRRDPLRRMKIQAAQLAYNELYRRVDEVRAKIDRISKTDYDYSNVLSAEEILNLNASDRAHMLHEKTRNDYSYDQKVQIDKATAQLKAKDPNALQKIQDIATLSEMIEDTEHSNSIFLDNMQAAADYFDYMANLRAERFTDVLERNAWKRADIEIEDDSLTNAERLQKLKTHPVEYVQHYLDEHPDQKNALKPALDIAKLTTDIKSAIPRARQDTINGIFQRTDLTKEQKDDAVRATTDAYDKIGKSAMNTLLDANVVDEASAMKSLEEQIDAESDEAAKLYLNKVLDEVAKIGHQRDATVIRTREQKAQEEEWAKKQERWSDGKNYGFDGYRKGDTIYHQDGRVGVIQRFYNDDNGTGRMVVRWGSNKVETDLRPSDLSKISKEKFNPNDVVVGGWRISKDSSKLPEGYEVGTVIDVYGDGNEYTISGIIVASSDSQDAVGKVALSSKSKESYMAIPVENLLKSKIIRRPESTVKSEQQSAQTQGKEQKPTVVETPRPESTKTDTELIGEGEEVPQFDGDGKIVPKTPEQESAEARGKTEGTPAIVTDTPAQDAANRPTSTSEPGLLEGNSMYRYDVSALKNFGIMKLRAGRQQGDSMNSFFNWLDKNKIQLQEIIDTELNTIIKSDPDTKVQFMMVNEPGVSRHVINVVEFTPEVEKIHNADLGGVIEAGGKRYLVIGTLYSNNGIDKFNAVAQPLREASKAEFDAGGKYFVHPTIYTKVAKIDAGRLVKQQVNETSAKFRTLGELFADTERNPHGINFKNAIMGIMYKDNYFVPNKDTGTRKIFPPGRSEATTGRVFLMIPTANGNYIPVALKSNVLLSEIKEGDFKDAIYTELRKIASPDLSRRQEGVSQLTKYLVLDDNTNILVGNDKHNNVSVVRNGTVVFSRNVDANFRTDEFEKAVFDTPFRINITQEDIESSMMLEWLDEAGALQTDVSMLRTANAAYQVFDVDTNGKPKEFKVAEPIPDNQKEGVAKTGVATTIANRAYRFIEGEYYDELNNVVTDPAIRANIKYNLMIQGSKLQPVMTGKSGAKIYIISDNPESPIVIKVSPEGYVTVADEQGAVDTITRVKEKAEAKRRAEEAQRALEAALDMGQFETVPSWNEESPIPEPQAPQPTPQPQAQKQPEKLKEIPAEKPKYDPNKATTKSLDDLQAEKKVTNFGTLYAKRRKELNDIAKQKGWNWGTTAKEKEGFLRKMGLTVDSITDEEAFMDMLKNCK